MTALGNIGVASGVLRDARITVGSSEALDAMARVVDGATTSVSAELFQLRDAPVVAAFRSAADRMPVRLLVDSEVFEDGGYKLPKTGLLELSEHGADPHKLHTKAIVADGSVGYVGTAAPVGGLRGPGKLDYAAELGPTEARVLERAIEAVANGDTTQVRATAEAAARVGLYYNDPKHGVTLLRDRIESLITGAEHSIVASSKILGDTRSVELLAAAKARGVDVLLITTPKSTKQSVKQARKAGIETVVHEEKAGYAHGNFLLADANQAYMGTAMLSRRGMARPEAARAARELGWVTEDRGAISTAADRLSALAGVDLHERFQIPRG
ncbi:MAG: PLD-like domain [Thermoleophilia bacterium]|nr:PLD-like domain [Thermoleophilia bacterium]